MKEEGKGGGGRRSEKLLIGSEGRKANPGQIRRKNPLENTLEDCEGDFVRLTR